MSMLTKAARKFDAAFAQQPPSVKKAALLAIYRAWPAFAQYQKDLEPLGRDPRIVDAVWDLLIGFGFHFWKRGRNAFSPGALADLAEAAPVTARFFAAVEAFVGSASAGPMMDVNAEAEVARLLGEEPPAP